MVRTNESAEIRSDISLPIGEKRLEEMAREKKLREISAMRKKLLDVRFLELPKVTHTKGTVFMDDDIESDTNSDPFIINLMRTVILRVQKAINLQTDLERSNYTKSTMYLG